MMPAIEFGDPSWYASHIDIDIDAFAPSYAFTPPYAFTPLDAFTPARGPGAPPRNIGVGSGGAGSFPPSGRRVSHLPLIS